MSVVVSDFRKLSEETNKPRDGFAGLQADTKENRHTRNLVFQGVGKTDCARSSKAENYFEKCFK